MTAPGRNPYPGLRAFQADETHLFFGRDEQRVDLLHRLRRSRLLAIVGTSGSGKSSLVRAGLLPGLHGGFMAGQSNRWRIVDLRPGTDAIGNLARALDTPGALREAPATDDEPTFTEATLRRSGLGLVEAVREARLPNAEKVLVLVDQFEELFRAIETADRPQSSDDASAFVRLLLEAAQQQQVPIYVVLTMRSDFLGECSRFRDLPEAINDGQYLVPRLTRDQRSEAIVGPAAVHGAVLSSTLVNRLLNDVGDNPDQLPILQHALMRTWDHWQRRTLDATGSNEIGLADYEAIGGMASALSLHADAVLEGLTEKGSPQEAARRKAVAQTLFKCLAGAGAGGVTVRRLARVQEIVDVTGAPEAEVYAVIEAFRAPGQSFLMPPAGEPLTPERYIDISHESLLRNWARMKTWIGEEADSARVYERLSSTAMLHAKGEAGLWDQPDLGVALQWHSTQKPTRAWAQRYNAMFEQAMAFLKASHTRAQAAENAKARRRGIWVFGTALMFFAMLTSILASVLADLAKARDVSRKADSTSTVLQSLDAIVKLHRARVTGAVEPEAGRFCGAYAFEEGLTTYRRGLWNKLCANATLEDDEQQAVAIYQQLLEGRWRDASEGTSKRGFTDGAGLLTLLGATRWPGDGSERRLLLELWRQQTAPSPEQQAGIARLVHPVHRRLAQILTGRLPDDLTPEEALLLQAYRTTESSGQPDDFQRYADLLYALPEGRVYGDVVLGASPPEWQVVESFGNTLDALDNYYSSTGVGFVWPLLVTWPVWRLWRLVQYRLAKPVAAKPHPLRRASAALFDLAFAVIIAEMVGSVVEAAARVCLLLLRSPDPWGGRPDAIAFWVGYIAGVTYLVCRDAIRLRFRRSFGKALFHLRPLVTTAADKPARTVRALIARNTIWLPVGIALYGSGLQFMGTYYNPGMSEAWVLAPLGLLTMAIVLLVDMARSWFKGRDTFLERWSKTTVVDADSAEALAIRP